MGNKVGAALGFDMPLDGEEAPASVGETLDGAAPLDDMSEEKAPQEQDAAVHAMRLFSKASTDEGKVEAIKGVLQALGVMDY